jgi:hypothetical protein
MKEERVEKDEKIKNQQNFFKISSKEKRKIIPSSP